LQTVATIQHRLLTLKIATTIRALWYRTIV
jgi:hypothetical protein